MEGEHELVYVDETTFNCWQLPSRCWLKKGMTVTLPDTRGHSITLIGALSSTRGLIYYQLFEGSNNQERFKRFI